MTATSTPVARSIGASLACVLALCACDPAPLAPDAGSSDAAPADASSSDAAPTDGGPPRDASVPVMGFEHCPPASSYVGSTEWGGRLRSSGALFCVFPQMWEEPASALASKQRLLLTPGEYRIPLAASDEPIRIPMCLERRGAELPAQIVEGSVSAQRRSGLDDETPRVVVDARHPLEGDARALHLLLTLEPGSTELDLDVPTTLMRTARASLCATEFCRDAAAGDVLMLPCNLESNTCDELEFEGGSVMVDQFHWNGPVGSGFAAGLRVRGRFAGVDFDITDYDSITVTYGHHAFSRALTLRFDAPIEGVCGLHVPEIAEGASAAVELLDCDGAPMGTRPLSAQTHLWRMPCP